MCACMQTFCFVFVFLSLIPPPVRSCFFVCPCCSDSHCLSVSCCVWRWFSCLMIFHFACTRWSPWCFMGFFGSEVLLFLFCLPCWQQWDKPSVRTRFDGWMCTWTHASVWPFFIWFHLINLISGILWSAADFIAGTKRRLPARNKGINQLLLEIIWYSHSPLFTHIWPPTMTQDPVEILLPIPLRYRLIPLPRGTKRCPTVGVEWGDELRGNHLGRCSLLMCHL